MTQETIAADAGTNAVLDEAPASAIPDAPTETLKQQALPVLLVLVVGTLLAAQVLLGKQGIRAGASPLSFLSFALMLAGFVLFVTSFVRRQGAALRGQVLEYGILSGLLFVLPNAVAFMAVGHVGAGFISMTLLFPLLITYLLALMLRVERFALWRMVALLLGLAGGVLLSASKAGLGDAPLFWILVSLTGPLFLAMGNIYRTMRWPTGVAPLFLASMMLLFAGAGLLPLALTFEGPSGPASLFQPATLPFLALEVATFSLLYLLYFILQKVAGPVYLSQIGLVGAVVGASVARLWLDEALPPNLLLSALMIGAGIVLFQWAGSRAKADRAGK
ncbi:EamA-like transporter family protein [Cohaesibacter sp. ES.047]|uniref:DMT family transporter n=1 Tax=Cohaesibacter sp. ES.047 TaxID=1798205 RepID=UPI000BB7A140|nr:DMT family transporter [Cohaesibacter sp. ES.047]SNY92064.1 EamA-like transporter family protein [Cohaesibacter sp. ES.047]